MTSAYLTDLRQQLRATRVMLNDELKHVPVDYAKVAVHERQIAHYIEEIKVCSTTEGDLLLSCCSSLSTTTSVTLMQLPTTPCMIGAVCLAYRLRLAVLQ